MDIRVFRGEFMPTPTMRPVGVLVPTWNSGIAQKGERSDTPTLPEKRQKRIQDALNLGPAPTLPPPKVFAARRTKPHGSCANNPRKLLNYISILHPQNQRPLTLPTSRGLPVSDMPFTLKKTSGPRHVCVILRQTA